MIDLIYQFNKRKFIGGNLIGVHEEHPTKSTIVKLYDSSHSIHGLTDVIVVDFVAMNDVQVMHKKSLQREALWELLGSQRSFAAVTP